MNDRLDSINKAIEAIENGAQEYQIGSRRIRRADLKTLYDERRTILSEISATEICSTRVAVFDTR